MTQNTLAYLPSKPLGPKKSQPCSKPLPWDGTINTWANGDKWLWKVCHELHEYDLAERNVKESRRGARAFAKAIIEGRSRWPEELLRWKDITEATFYRLWDDGPDGWFRTLPPWLNKKNLPPPQLARVAKRIAEIEADIAHERRAARIWS